MTDKDLLSLFYERYTTKDETMYRLPMDVAIGDFWPHELQYRLDRAVELPLKAYDGASYYFTRTRRFLDAADIITEMARNDSDISVFADLGKGGMADEAYYSSAIEGAYSTREKARIFIESGKDPADKNERMILNNYNALRFVMQNPDRPVTLELIEKIGVILTEGTLEEGVRSGYRDDGVFVRSHTGDIVYTAPSAEHVIPMMEQLVAYMNDPDVHPIEKAVVSHVYFVTVHPFFDGNGRTARALTYMILLKAGYDFFRYVPVSGILFEKRPAYYKALAACQDRRNGDDLTYFTDFYTDLLAQNIKAVSCKIASMGKYLALKERLAPESDARLLKGAFWIVDAEVGNVTAEKWKNKFAVSFETARQDLWELERLGFLAKSVVGRKIYYSIR